MRPGHTRMPISLVVLIYFDVSVGYERAKIPFYSLLDGYLLKDKLFDFSYFAVHIQQIIQSQT